MPQNNNTKKVLKYARRMAHILYAIEYLGRYCQICGLDGFEEPWAMDFHHKDESQKLYEVKNKLYNSPFSNHKDEIDKCALICVKCHRQNHSNYKMYNELKTEIMNKLDQLKMNGGDKLKTNHLLSDEERDSIIELIGQGLIMTEIAKQLGLNYGTVKSFVKRHKLGGNRRTRIKIPGQIVIKMLSARHSIRSIAEKLQINRETLRQYIRENIQETILDNGVKLYSIKS